MKDLREVAKNPRVTLVNRRGFEPDLDHDDEQGGAFEVTVPGAKLRVIASTGLGWDHVSVSLKDRCPDWAEMERVKRIFFKDDEIAYQFHMPPSDHINIHPYTLHIWRCQDLEMPTPPRITV